AGPRTASHSPRRGGGARRAGEGYLARPKISARLCNARAPFQKVHNGHFVGGGIGGGPVATVSRTAGTFPARPGFQSIVLVHAGDGLGELCRAAVQPAVARSVWYRPISSGDSGPLFLRPACGLSELGGDIGLDGGHSLVCLALPFPMGRMARNLAEWLGSGGVPDRFPRVALVHDAKSSAA